MWLQWRVGGIAHFAIMYRVETAMRDMRVMDTFSNDHVGHLVSNEAVGVLYDLNRSKEQWPGCEALDIVRVIGQWSRTQA
jgi:hypothetical protein